MKKLLLIVLLIVGCAHKPPTATFYIGMTEEEFIVKNPNATTTCGCGESFSI